MATTVGEILFSLGLKTDGLDKQLSDTSNKVKDSFKTQPVDNFNKQVKKTTGISGDLSKTIGKLGKIISVTFAVSKITDFAKACSEAASIQEQAEVKLETVMQRRMNATSKEIASVKKLASELQKVGVVGDEVAIAGAAQFATYVNSTEAIKTMLPEMENLAASLYGANVSAENMKSIADQVGKAMSTGSLSTLVRSGITVTEEEKRIWEGITSEQERAAFLAQIINQNVGNMNEAMAGTFAGTMQRLKNSFGDLFEVIGSGLNSVLIPLVNALTKIVDRFTESVKNLFVSLGLRNAEEEAEESSANIASNYSNATSEAKELKRTILKFDNINKLNDNSSSSISLDSSTLGEFGSTASSIKSQITPVQEAVQMLIDDISGENGLSKVWENLLEGMEMWIPGSKEAINGFTTDFGYGLEIIGMDAKEMWEDLKSLFDPQTWKDAGEAVVEIWKWVGEKLSEKFKQIKDWIKSIFNVSQYTKEHPGVSKTATGSATMTRAVPHFANGGYVPANSPQLAVVGDNKTQGEYIVPENQLGALNNTQEIVSVLGQILNAVVNKNVSVSLDGREISKSVWNETNNVIRSTGYSPIRA